MFLHDFIRGDGFAITVDDDGLLRIPEFSFLWMTIQKKKEFSVCLSTILIRIVRISFPGKGVLPNV